MSGLAARVGRWLERAFARRPRPDFRQLLDEALGAGDRVTLSLEAVERGFARHRPPRRTAH